MGHLTTFILLRAEPEWERVVSILAVAFIILCIVVPLIVTLIGCWWKS